MTPPAFDVLFAPDSIAVVGASASEEKAGYLILKNILDGGFEGRVHPVNPKGDTILGLTSHRTVGEIPEVPDLAILVVSNELVIPVLHECVAKGVRAVLIVTAGFGEVGEEGRAAQEEVARILRESGMRGVGPNSVGLVSAPNRLLSSFVPFREWPSGPVAIAAQTGNFTGAYADDLAERTSQRIGFSRSISLGNTVDLDEADFVEFASQDPETRVIALHLESFRRARAFLAAANRAKRTKPVVVLKAGRSEAGARAAASHSGALAGQDHVVDAAFRQYGIVRAETVEDFIGIMKAFAWQPVPRGGRVGIITLTGAFGVMAVDEMDGTGLTLAQFAPETVERIRNLMPDWQPVGNPADIWMALGAGSGRAHEECLDAVLSDPDVDMLLCILLAIPNTDFEEVRAVFQRLRTSHPDKPIVGVLTGGQVKQRWLNELEPLAIPIYEDLRPAVRAMEALRFYGEHRTRDCPDPLRALERSQSEPLS